MTRPTNFVPCPECNGAGLVNVVWQGLPESVADAAECPVCRGIGEISPRHAARLETGRAMRKDRIARGVSLAEEAARLGIGKRELADREWGRCRDD